LAFYVVLASFFRVEVVVPYLSLLLDPIRDTIAMDRPFVLIPVLFSAGVVLLGWPQLALALLGGFLFDRFKITITPR